MYRSNENVGPFTLITRKLMSHQGLSYRHNGRQETIRNELV